MLHLPALITLGQGDSCMRLPGWQEERTVALVRVSGRVAGK